jgi:hypothetical protein
LGTGARHLEGATFRELGPAAVVELPTTRVRSILVEAFVETDDVSVDLSSGGPGRLTWGSTRRAGRVEVTVGVLGPEGSLHAFTPSITVAAPASTSRRRPAPRPGGPDPARWNGPAR